MVEVEILTPEKAARQNDSFLNMVAQSKPALFNGKGAAPKFAAPDA
jgi:hypothetical protein